MRERGPLVWERETGLREEEFETFGSSFERNWEIERVDWWAMGEEESRAKMAMFSHGVRERSGGGSAMSEDVKAHSWS